MEMFNLFDVILVLITAVTLRLLDRIAWDEFRSMYNRWLQKKRYPKFYHDRKYPMINEKNVLLLFHGKKDEPKYAPFINYDGEWIYTIDCNPDKKPHYVMNLVDTNQLDLFEAKTFDKILVPNCICCVNDIARFEAAPFFHQLVRMLRPRGKLYVSRIMLFAAGLKPVDLKMLNQAGMRTYDGKTLTESTVHQWTILTKEPALPEIEDEPPLCPSEETKADMKLQSIDGSPAITSMLRTPALSTDELSPTPIIDEAPLDNQGCASPPTPVNRKLTLQIPS